METLLTFEEAGLTMKWVGQEMIDGDVVAGATLDFECCPDKREELVLHLIENGVDEERALEIADEVSLSDLIGFELIQA